MNTAIILAAGTGRKMWPYNAYRSKTTLPVGGIPSIVRMVDQLKEIGFNNIIITVSYFERQIKYLLRKKSVHFVSIDTPCGTAYSLEKVIKIVPDDEALIIYGDIVTTEKVLNNLLKQFKAFSCEGMLLVDSIVNERSQDWMCVKTAKDGKALQIYGHPRRHYVDSRLVGIYAVKLPDVKNALEQTPEYMMNINVGVMPQLEAEFEQTIQLLIDQGKLFYTVEAKGNVVDLDKPWHIMEANRMLIEQEVKTLKENIIPSTSTICSSSQITGKIALGENVEIGKNVVIEGNVVVGDRTKIKNGAIIGANSIIGSDSLITDFSKIGENSVVGNENRIGYSAEFQGVTFDKVSFLHFGEAYGVIGTSTDIAAGVTMGNLRFDDLEQEHIINGRKEVPKQFSTAIFIGDYTRTGINSLYLPGVKVGANCAIGPGVIVSQDVDAETLLYLEQNITKKEWGTKKYGW